MNAVPLSTPTDWLGVRRLLVVRLDHLGDVLMTTPALAALRAALPAAHLTLLASPAGAALAPHLPMVDEVLPWVAPWMQAGAQARPDGAEAAIVERLADGRYDAAIVCTVCTQSALPAALLCRMAGIPRRLAHARENPYALLTDWAPETDAVESGMRHEVQRQLDLVARVGLGPAAGADTRLQCRVEPADRVRVRQRLAAAGAHDARPLVVVHPGATAESRRWPVERHAAVARALQLDGARVVWAGDSADAARLAEAGAVAPGQLSTAGQLRLGELIALMDTADLLVGVNSGPMHIAAAVGTPVVVAYALTNPQHGPWQVPARVLSHDVDCRWCLKSRCPAGHHRCLLGVGVDEVLQAARALLRAGTAPARCAPRAALVPSPPLERTA